MNPAAKRFKQRYGMIADAVASVDIDQADRERVAKAITDALTGHEDFRPDVFELLASDPLVRCTGGCGLRIRIPMHLSSAPDGRSAEWAPRPPQMRCVSCGPFEKGLST